MNQSPLEYAESLHIGVVEFVSPNEIKVSLDIEAPESVALNTGIPRPFPRVNGYVLIPNDDGYLVGQVEWLTIEPSPYPKRRGMMDFGLVDLPYPIRKLSLNPVGTLTKKRDSEREDTFHFKQGVESFPTVGDNVLLPTQIQLRSIVESGENRRVKIGTSALAGNAEIFVDPDRLFGRHLAVLGNTGSGKSCSVAGLIRWSLEAAQKTNETPNARFIVLDPNGEYERAFNNETGFLKPRIFTIDRIGDRHQLLVPLWFWNSSEWCSFTLASSRTQRPALIHALGTVRSGNANPPISATHDTRRFLRTLVTIIQAEKNAGVPWGQFPKNKNFNEKIKKWRTGLNQSDLYSEEEKTAITNLADYIDQLVNARSAPNSPLDFSREEIDLLLRKTSDAHAIFGGTVTELHPINVDTPLEFSGEALLRSLEASSEILNVTEHVETMLIRVRALLNDNRLNTIIGAPEGFTLDQWLNEYIGDNQSRNGCLTIIDLSLVPSEIIHVVTAVIARMVFEALQRYRKLNENHKVLPTVLVMEEAHTYVRRYKDDVENQDAAAICCKVFERIAREGRKFGLGLVLSSQRPSELSPTVLSQCNTFLLHRISNDNDQDLVHRYVPDNLRGLLRDLPILPSQNAILLGWASELPVIVRMNDLPKSQQPQSDDPDFWKVWTGEDERSIDWKYVADTWQGKKDLPPQAAEPAPAT